VTKTPKKREAKTAAPKSKRKFAQKAWLQQDALASPLENQIPPEPLKPPALRQLLDRVEVCEMIGTSYPTLWAWMVAGKFPRNRIVGGKSKWLAAEIYEWIRTLPVRRIKGDPLEIRKATD
jgi:predicted DNA-binding transcriptional regulator AlpA